jgi:hypothetical protein
MLALRRRSLVQLPGQGPDFQVTVALRRLPQSLAPDLHNADDADDLPQIAFHHVDKVRRNCFQRDLNVNTVAGPM